MTTLNAEELQRWIEDQHSVSVEGRRLIVKRMRMVMFDGYAIGESGMEGRAFVDDIGSDSGQLRRLLFPRARDQEDWSGDGRVEQPSPNVPGGRQLPPLPSRAEVRSMRQTTQQEDERASKGPVEGGNDPAAEMAAAAASQAAREAAARAEQQAFLVGTYD